MISSVGRLQDPSIWREATQPLREADTKTEPTGSNTEEKLSDAERSELLKLRQRDAEVRSHEAAHAASGGQYAGSPSYSFARGPDGQSYAVGGEVPIDVSAVPNDPSATIRKMMQVRQAALAPADPSGADRAIAALADRQAAEARMELTQRQIEEMKSVLSAASREPNSQRGGTPASEERSVGRSTTASRAISAYRAMASSPAPNDAASKS